MAYEVATLESVTNEQNQSKIVQMGEAEYESLPTTNLLAHMAAGAAAGVMEHTVMYPVDCVKTRMMTILPTHKANYSSVPSALVSIARTEKPRTLFRGMTVVATAAGPAHALYFSLYEMIKKAVSDKNSVVSQGIAGACATVVHDGFMNPVDVVKQRLQMYRSPYRGAVDCIKTVYHTEGLRAFYRSYGTQLCMNVPFQVLHFMSYEFFQDILNSDRHYDPKSHIISGAGAGAFAAAVTTPLDVAKTYLNITQQQRDLQRSELVRGMVGAFRAIYRQVGIRGYFKGLSARVLFQMPSTAICWSVYETFKYLLGLKDIKPSDNDHKTLS